MAIKVKKLEKFSTNVRKLNFTAQVTGFFLRLLWYAAPSLAVRLVKNHVFSPISYRTGAEEEQILASGSRFQIEVNSKKVQGWKWGEGPGILFVHGWNGRGIQLSRFFKPLVQAGYAVITFDAPGHGESDGKTSSYFELTDTVRTILNQQQKFNIVGLIGHSLGGAAVINALSKENISLPGVLIAPAIRLRDVLFNAFELFGIPGAVYHKAIEEFELRFGYSLEKDDPWKLMPKVNSNIVIVHDRRDRSIPLIDSRDVAGTRPNVMLHETEGLGHRKILKNRKIVELVTGHILDHDSPFRHQTSAPDPIIRKTGLLGIKSAVQPV